MRFIIFLFPLVSFAGVDRDKVYQAATSYPTIREYKTNMEDYIAYRFNEKAITSMSMFYKVLNTKKITIQIKNKSVRYYIEFKPNLGSIKFVTEF
jgi:hypothetical protein